ncbi:hypothetical protein IF1G_04228 [Cordyceps javanica]|uniref:Uncharacterized protein n=1 Tax=Cordyceps javanica TaxID=43265 RepID=A0A545V5M9_9HYPO|nr:hypothetical protein IF1G_04228 [Cordyceps javanica]
MPRFPPCIVCYKSQQRLAQNFYLCRQARNTPVALIRRISGVFATPSFKSVGFSFLYFVKHKCHNLVLVGAAKGERRSHALRFSERSQVTRPSVVPKISKYSIRSTQLRPRLY